MTNSRSIDEDRYNKYIYLKSLNIKKENDLSEGYTFLMDNPDFFKDHVEYTIGLTRLYKAIVLTYNLEIANMNVQFISRFTRLEMIKALVKKIIRTTISDADMNFYIKNFKYLMSFFSYKTRYFFGITNINSKFMEDFVEAINLVYSDDRLKFEKLFGLYYLIRNCDIGITEAFMRSITPKQKRKLIIAPLYKCIYYIKNLRWYFFDMPDYIDLE